MKKKKSFGKSFSYRVLFYDIKNKVYHLENEVTKEVIKVEKERYDELYKEQYLDKK